MKYSKAGHNKEFSKLTEGVFSSRSSAKQRELYDAMKTVGRGGVNKGEMERVVGHFMKYGGRYISKKDAGNLAHVLREKGFSSRGYTYKGADIFANKDSAAEIKKDSNSAIKKRVYEKKTDLKSPAPVKKDDSVKMPAPAVKQLRDISPSF